EAQCVAVDAGQQRGRRVRIERDFELLEDLHQDLEGPGGRVDHDVEVGEAGIRNVVVDVDRAVLQLALGQDGRDLAGAVGVGAVDEDDHVRVDDRVDAVAGQLAIGVEKV